jgi:nucleotide-binding universal stress UspA family protein
MFSRVLVPVDFSPCSERAARFAVDLARQFESEVTFLHIDVWRAPDDHGIEPPASRSKTLPDSAQIEEQLTRMVASAEARGARAHSRCVRSLGIVPAIISFADSNQVSVIVVASHGYRGMRRFVLGSTTDELLRTAKRPIVVIPGDGEHREETLNTILVPVDLSGRTPSQVDRAVDLAARSESNLVLAYVVEPMPLPSFLTGLGTLGDLSPSLDAQIDRAMKRLSGKASESLGREVGFQIRHGRAAREIVELARDVGAGLIVMSRHGHSGIDRLFLGSVTERVTRSTTVPILVVSDEYPSET